jgi:formylglycine-generating enzyme required for sulfatase activity
MKVTRTCAVACAILCGAALLPACKLDVGKDQPNPQTNSQPSPPPQHPSTQPADVPNPTVSPTAAQTPPLRPTPFPTFTLKIPSTTNTYDLVKLPSGTVELPPEKAGQAAVTVSIKPFWIGQTEVTWDCYDVFAFALDLKGEERNEARGMEGSRPSAPYGPPDEGFGHESYPVINAHPKRIEDYCKWLSQKTGRHFRLPTEAEWIYACRAGAEIPKNPDKLKEVAWFREKEAPKQKPNNPRIVETTHPIAQRKPNSWGLYDMFGNVGEFVQPLKDKEYFIKGGSVKDQSSSLTLSFRDFFTEDWQFRDPTDPKSTSWLSDAPFAGFRLVMDDPPASP